MKNFIALIVLSLVGSSVAQAALTANEIYLLNNSMGSTARKVQLGTKLGAVETVSNTNTLESVRVAKAVFDPSGVAGQRTVAAHGLGVMLPAKALLIRTFFYTKTAVTSTGDNGTIAFHCGAANDLFSAADIDASSGVLGGIGVGVQTGSSVVGAKILASECEITATVAVNALLTGKIDLFVEYVIAE